jgi:hypothetical protein
MSAATSGIVQYAVGLDQQGAHPAPGSWWAHETRIGRYLYPLRAMSLAAGVGATVSIVGVVAAVHVVG